MKEYPLERVEEITLVRRDLILKVIERVPYYIPIYCHHCVRQPCRDSCPIEAISRNEWGIVRVDEELCIGCKARVEA